MHVHSSLSLSLSPSVYPMKKVRFLPFTLHSLPSAGQTNVWTTHICQVRTSFYLYCVTVHQMEGGGVVFSCLYITLPPVCVDFLCHRSLGTAQRIEAEIRERKVTKEYVCRVVGEFPE